VAFGGHLFAAVTKRDYESKEGKKALPNWKMQVRLDKKKKERVRVRPTLNGCRFTWWGKIKYADVV